MKKELLSERTVRSVFESIEILHPKTLPRTLCIDESHAESGFWIKKSHHWNKDKYNVNVTDVERCVVVYIFQQRTLAFLSSYFKKTYPTIQRMDVIFFCCDMNGSFISLAKSCFPKAIIVVDNFHAIQILTKSMDKIRCREQDRLEKEESKDGQLIWSLHHS
ncbi:MAG: transposase [Lachnospiraceae bacterium]|nr:transposase [Lachnospiraceae bacterium]